MGWRIYADRGGNLGVWVQVGSRTAYELARGGVVGGLVNE